MPHFKQAGDVHQAELLLVRVERGGALQQGQNPGKPFAAFGDPVRNMDQLAELFLVT